MKKLFLLTLFLFPWYTYGLTTFAEQNIFNGQPGNPNFEDYLSLYVLAAFNVPTQINQNTQVSVSILKSGQANTPYIGRANMQCSSGCVIGQNVFQSGSTLGNYSYSTNLSVSNYGTYTLGLDIAEIPNFISGPVHHINYSSNPAEFAVNPTLPQCSDNIDNNDNDNPPLSDEADPQCHTDCNPNNLGSYAPNHNSESTPPNGTCPAPATLQLNGRAAFLQVVKNFVAFITTKAFAGE